jgi:hypothetical protein
LFRSNSNELIYILVNFCCKIKNDIIFKKIDLSFKYKAIKINILRELDKKILNKLCTN